MKIRRRVYKPKAKQIRKALDRVYSIIGRIKHAYDLSDDPYQYAKMKKDLVMIAMETNDIASVAQRIIQTSFKHN